MIRFSCIVLCALFTGAAALKLTRLSVPKLLDFRDSALMTCEFDLENRKLYSVKWYKDDLEFFRYMPNNYPQVQTFDVDGVHLDVQSCNMTLVTLHRLEFSTSGLYACEVSTEAPHFKTVQTSSFMRVIATALALPPTFVSRLFAGLPRTDPVVTGLKPMYSVGEFVRANCTSDKSYPLATLQWYINNNQVEQWQLVRYEEEDAPEEQEIKSATLGLSFQADYNHFSGKGNTMHLKCLSKVADIVNQRIYVAKLADLDLDKYAQGLLRNSGTSHVPAGAKASGAVAVLTGWIVRRCVHS